MTYILPSNLGSSLIEMLHLFCTSELFSICIFLFFIFFIAWVPKVIRYIWR